MKVGIITFHHFMNYGSALQAYAMQEGIGKLGAETEIIDYRPVSREDTNGNRLKRNIRNLLKRSVWKRYLEEKRYLKKIHFEEIQQERTDKFLQFQNRFRLSPCIAQRNDLEGLDGQYDGVVCGSDQVWNPTYVKHDMSYFLDFVGDCKKRIAYAPSIAVNRLPEEYEKEIREQLIQFENISVREEESIPLVYHLTGKRAETVADPTLLLTREEWERIAVPADEYINEEPYILCYFLGNDQDYRNYVDCLKELTGLKILLIPHMYFREIGAFYDYGDVQCNGVGPSEFLYLIQNAEYVCTDSFHGTVFSILFQRKFFTFKRYSDSDKSSENSRVYTLLKGVGETGRLLSSSKDMERLYDTMPDYQKIGELLDEKRKSSVEFLRKEFARLSC